MTTFSRGDRVRYKVPNKGRWSHLGRREGTYVSLSRSGTEDLVRWDGAKKTEAINRDHIELIDTPDLDELRMLGEGPAQEYSNGQ